MQGGGDWWWLCPFGALALLLWWRGGGVTNKVVGVDLVHGREFNDPQVCACFPAEEHLVSAIGDADFSSPFLLFPDSPVLFVDAHVKPDVQWFCLLDHSFVA